MKHFAIFICAAALCSGYSLNAKELIFETLQQEGKGYVPLFNPNLGKLNTIELNLWFALESDVPNPFEGESHIFKCGFGFANFDGLIENILDWDYCDSSFVSKETHAITLTSYSSSGWVIGPFTKDVANPEYFNSFQGKGKRKTPFFFSDTTFWFADHTRGNFVEVPLTAKGVKSHGYGNITFKYNYTPAPEPAVWAILVGGFGVVGQGLRAKRKRRVAIS